MKPCSKCAEVKPLDKFPSNPSARDGKKNICKVCIAAAQKESRNNGYSNKCNLFQWKPPTGA